MDRVKLSESNAKVIYKAVHSRKNVCSLKFSKEPLNTNFSIKKSNQLSLQGLGALQLRCSRSAYLVWTRCCPLYLAFIMGFKASTLYLLWGLSLSVVSVNGWSTLTEVVYILTHQGHNDKGQGPLSPSVLCVSLSYFQNGFLCTWERMSYLSERGMRQQYKIIIILVKY